MKIVDNLGGTYVEKKKKTRPVVALAKKGFVISDG